MPIHVPDMSKINFESILRHFDFAGALKDFAEQTPNAIDDFLVAQFAETLQESFYSLFRRHPIYGAPHFEPAFDAEHKEQKIRELARVRGVTLSPIMIAVLMRLAWPLIELILDRMKSEAP